MELMDIDKIHEKDNPVLQENDKVINLHTTKDTQNQNFTNKLDILTNGDCKQNRSTPKKPPDILCNCPQKCFLRVSQDIKSTLYKEFCSLGDHVKQNAFLQSYIEMRSVYKRLWSQEERIGGRLQRRVSCKYKIPIDIPKLNMKTAAELPHQPAKLIRNSKGQATVIIGVRDGCETIEVCQKAFMNVYGITEKRIRLQREKLIARLRSNHPDQLRLGNNNSNTKIDKELVNTTHRNSNNNNNGIIIKNSSGKQNTAGKTLPFHQLSGYNHPEDEEDQDYQDGEDELAIVDTFFRNQLWKPEYIGISADRLQYLDVYYNNVYA